MPMWSRFRTRLSSFGTDRGGHFAMMLAVLAACLCLAAGYALNTVQLVSARSNLLNALDSAVTSTARDLTTGKIAEEDARASVEAFLLSNGGTAFVDLDRLALSSLEVDRRAQTVEAEAAVDIDLAFPLFGMARTQRVATRSAALYSDRRIEIAMMLDITASMRGQKIEDLRAAAGNAVGILTAGQENLPVPRVRIALVPYADAVNVGGLSNLVYGEQDENSDSEPPALDDPMPVSGSSSDRCATEREGDHQFTDVSPYEAMVNRDYRLHFCPESEMMPLTADRTALTARIEAMEDNGHTSGSTGIQWSWYMLSPQWADVLPEPARPQPHDEDEVDKYAILMTDGEFNTAYADVPHGDGVRHQQGRAREHAERLCEEMKQDGIKVFTIGFMLGDSAKQVLQRCASPQNGSVRHYFDTSSGEELVAAYEEIARNIESLALTQ